MSWTTQFYVHSRFFLDPGLDYAFNLLVVLNLMPYYGFFGQNFMCIFLNFFLLASVELRKRDTRL